MTLRAIVPTGCAAAALLAALASCAGQSEGQQSEGAGTAPAVALRMTADDGRGRRYAALLECRGALRRHTGYLRRRSPSALCATARRLAGFLASRPDPDRICTQVYGGPERARVRGRIGSRAVDRRFARTDGCEIGDWDRTRLLLPRPRGASLS